MTHIIRDAGRLVGQLAKIALADPGAFSASHGLQKQHLQLLPKLWTAHFRHLTGGEDVPHRPPPPPAPHATRDPLQSHEPRTAPPPSPRHPSSDGASSPSPSSSSPSPSAPSTTQSGDSEPAKSTKPATRAARPKAVPKPRPNPTPKPNPDAATGRDGDGDSDDVDEQPYPHQHFVRGETFRKLHPGLEAAELEAALIGVAGTGDDAGTGAANMSYLYDSPVQRLMGAMSHPLRAAAGAAVYGWVGRITEWMLQQEVESSFDLNEFLEGIRQQAVPAFYQAAAAADWQALRQMASEKVVEAVARDRRRLAEDRGLQPQSVHTTYCRASVRGANLWGPDAVRQLAPSWLRDMRPELSKSWLVLSVAMDVRLNVSYRRSVGEEGGDGEGGGEEQGVMRRSGAWVMARGPLPRGCSESLEANWRILGWV